MARLKAANAFTVKAVDRPLAEPIPAVDFPLGLDDELSPVAYVTADGPPPLIIHGDADRLVPLQQAELMHERHLK